MRYSSPSAGSLRPATSIVALALVLAVGAASARAEGPLGELDAAMGQAQSLLEQGETGGAVQRLQEDIVRRLDALIASPQAGLDMPPTAKPREGKAQAERPAETTGPPEKPADRSTLPGGTWTYGPMRAEAEPEDAWLPRLPPTERKAIVDAFRSGRLPPRYRELLRQYNRRLAEEERGGAEGEAE